jgi:hypothetical protein
VLTWGRSDCVVTSDLTFVLFRLPILVGCALDVDGDDSEGSGTVMAGALKTG